jgi:hypothetical protein
MHAAGPVARRDAIDVTRVLALLIVVFGHLLMAVIDRPGGAMRGANLLALHPGWVAVAALAPMPMFFAAGGWANATATLATALPRLRTLVGLGAIVVCAWSAGVVVMALVVGDPGVVGDGARIATEPLWFVAAYVPLAAFGGRLARLAADHIVLALGSGLALLAALDVARFALEAPAWIGWPGFYLAWGTPWLVGAWWRARHLAGGFDERRVGALLALAAGAGCLALVAFAGYDPALIDAVPGARSNTTPPTLYTAVAALAQVGLLIMGARLLDRAGRRWRRLWDRAGEAAVGVYAWHLTALALCAALISAGLPAPERLTTLWWVTRPVWWAAVLTLTGGFVSLTAIARARLRRGRDGSRPSDRPTLTNALGVLTAAAAGAAVGLRGPRTIPLALACSGLFVISWACLRPQRRTA